MAAHLLILGDRAGLRWVLRNERMAFPTKRTSSASVLRTNDSLLLYTTRGCFGNPGRDQGRVIGCATVLSSVELVDPVIHISGRAFSTACDIALRSLAPFGHGVPLATFVNRLEVFPDPRSWSVWLRRPLLALPASDAQFLLDELSSVATDPQAVLKEYLG